MNYDHYTMGHFEVQLGSNNSNSQSIGSHHPHIDHFGSWNFLHNKIHNLIDVVQPPSGMSANIDFRKDDPLPCPSGPPASHLAPIKVFTGELAETVWRLRSDIPYLSKTEISDYRNSYYQNLCLCMLSQGYHRAFTEIFDLVGRQEKERQEAGPDSVIWSLSPISMQEDKLELLKDCLCTAEDYYRIDDYRGMLESYNRLAQFFKTYPEDKWLVDHFLRYCLTVSKKIVDDNNYKHAVANYELGLAIEENKEYDESYQYFYALYSLSKEQSWKNKDKKLLFHEACEHLAYIRLAMASQLNDHNHDSMVLKIAYIREAYDFSKLSTNKKLEAECSYRLGVAYFDSESSDVALSYLMQYYTISREIEDSENICLACEALANVYSKQRKFNDCIKFLEEFVATAEHSGLNELFSRACRRLGDTYNHLGEFTKASNYFDKSYKISQNNKISGGPNSDTINEARILFGVSKGNNINLTYGEHVEVATKTALERLINWKKENKVETSDIGKPIPNKPDQTLRARTPNRNIFDAIGAYPKI